MIGFNSFSTLLRKYFHVKLVILYSSVFSKQLTILTGLPWLLIPGNIANELPGPGLEYIYVIFNALQGFFVFIVLVATSDRVRHMWGKTVHEMSLRRKVIWFASPSSSEQNTSVWWTYDIYPGIYMYRYCWIFTARRWLIIGYGHSFYQSFDGILFGPTMYL